VRKPGRRSRARRGSIKVEQVLARAGLTLEGQQVTRAGRAVTNDDCQLYKHAVRAVYGDATYAFAKVNFVLGGCSCRDCIN
jgi:hypothetical protein